MSNKPIQHKPATTTTSLTHTQIKGQIFHSDYPPPEMMEKYKEVDPDFPNRLLKMAEEQGAHRKWADRILIRGSLILDTLGMILAPASVAGILFVGYLFMKNGYGNEGAWIIGTVTVTLAIAFITRGRRNPNQKK